MKKNKILIFSILIALFIEIFICNYSFFRTLLLGNLNVQADYKMENDILKISNINCRVTSINFKYKEKLIDKVTYIPYYTFKGSSDKIEINPKIVLKNSRQYINLDTHTECETIEISFLTENKLDFENIILNHPNININLFRILIIYIVVLFIIKAKKEDIFSKQYDKNSKQVNRLFLCNLTIFCAFIVMYIVSQFNFEGFLVAPEHIDKNDSILMQTESIVNGQIELLEEPAKELKEMENPYDHIKRDNEDIPYLYDVAYYNNHYYNYFGIAPIITMILPFRLLTGFYTHSYIFNLIYVIIAIYALHFLYKKLVDRYIEKISIVNFCFGFYAILFASNILTLLRGAKYDIVVSSGIMFLLISLNLAISIYTNKKLKILKLILLGFTTGLIVLSKPNLIIYYFVILFFVLYSMKNLSTKEKIINAIFTTIPLGALAIFQMVLNYIRFDNILEFGAKYQLTGLNLESCMLITFGKIYAGVVQYLFRVPTINPLQFPFIFANVDTSLTSINEICYENRLIGLVAIPILWIYLFKNNILKQTDNKEFKIFIKVIIVVSILALIINTCFGGICEAYSIDFKLLLSIGAIILLLKWIEKDEDKTKHKIAIILCLATIIIMLPLSLTTESELLNNFASDVTVYLKNVFEFWA